MLSASGGKGPIGRTTGTGMELHEKPGERVWILAETDYRFGAGELRMTIDSVDWAEPQTHDGLTWYGVRGIEVAADGRIIGPRQTMVKASRLRPIRSPGPAN
jgi:hypothetical protein